MSNEKLIHVPREGYPEPIYPQTPATLIKAYPDELGTHLLDYWRIILERRWTVIAILSTIVIATVIWTFKQIPIYRATASIQIDRENTNILSFKDVFQVETATDDTLQTQFKVLASRSLARRVIEELHLENAEEFRPGQPGILASMTEPVRELFVASSEPKTKGEPDRLRPVIDAYLGRLNVSPIRLSRLANVSFESKDPELAARVINDHAKLFIDRNFEFKWEATQQASDFLSQQLVTLKANLEKAEDKLQEYSRANQIMFTEEGKDGRNTTTEKLMQLEQEYTKAQTEQFGKESYDRLARSGNVDALPQLTNNPLISGLMTRLAELKREESSLAVTFGPEYPKRKQLLSQIEEVERTIQGEKSRTIRTVQGEYTAAVDRAGLLLKALDQQRELVNKMNQDTIQYNILKREADSNKQLYEGLLTRLKEAGISAGLRASNIRVVDRAEVPRTPVRPQKGTNILLGLAIGLVAGIGAAFFQEYMDNSVKSPDDVNRYFDLPVLGVIPDLRSLSGRPGYGYGYGYGSGGRKKVDGSAPSITETEEKPVSIDLISHVSPRSLLAEGYRSIRTSLLLSSADHAPRLVVVTSAVPSEGKTATAINIAVSLTQTGARVVLVDSDMRRPRIHFVLGLENEVGLSNFLTGSAGLKEVIKPTEVSNLYAIPCGPIPPNPAELILSHRFRQMLQALSEYCDYVILDSPPVANVSDSRVLASNCEATIFVVKASTTSRHLVKQALEHLVEANAHVAGIVLNDLDLRSKSHYYPYYSGAYSHYSSRA